MRRRRVLFGALAAVVAALVLSQLLLPRYLEGRAEDRLTERGGRATVSLSAFPALRLLGSGGDRIEVRGAALSVGLGARRERVLDRLDGFDEVDVEVVDLRAGPFLGRSFSLARAGSKKAPYTLRLRAEVTARGLSEYAAESLGGALGGLLGELTREALPLDGEPIPVRLDAQLESRDGRAEVVAGGGSVAGIPAGPLAEALAVAVAARL